MISNSQQDDQGRSRETQELSYTERLVAQESVWWKRFVDVQAPYRWNLRRLKPGFVLDIGCGLGRNLIHLQGHGVGVDHNPNSVMIARERGLQAFTPAEFIASPFGMPGRFDSLLMSHVIEHMTEASASGLLAEYLPFLRPQGLVILITPQERGYRSDPTHVQFMDFDVLRRVVSNAGIELVRTYSFPLPRLFGSLFRHNEFVFVGKTS